MKLIKSIKIFSYILIPLLLIYDISIAFFTNFRCFYIFAVDGNYIYYVFSAIITVGVLGITLMSIALNSISREYIGFEIKSLIEFNSSPVDMLSLIKHVFMAMSLSVGLLFLGFPNASTAVLFCIIVYIGVNSYILWLFIIKDTEKEKLILLEIEFCLIHDEYQQISLFIQRISCYICDQTDKRSKESLPSAFKCLEEIEKGISNES